MCVCVFFVVFFGGNEKKSIPHRIHGTDLFTYICFISMVNVGNYSKYTIHGSCGKSTIDENSSSKGN